MASLPADSYYVTLLPNELKVKDANTLSTCSSNPNFECWTFLDGNLIILHSTASISPIPYRFDIPNLNTLYSALHYDI